MQLNQQLVVFYSHRVIRQRSHLVTGDAVVNTLYVAEWPRLEYQLLPYAFVLCFIISLLELERIY